MPGSDEAPKIFSTFEAAQMIGVDMTTVIGWCKQGKLAAYKTPGKHRRIKCVDLVAFLTKYKMPIPDAIAQMEAAYGCLIVDDEAPIRGLIKRAVREINPAIHIDEASDGFEAGRKISDMHPDLVILDLNLPGMDGFKVCKILKSDPELTGTKILAISGFDTAETHQRITEAGADEFLPKPFKPQTLKDKILHLLPAIKPAR